MKKIFTKEFIDDLVKLIEYKIKYNKTGNVNYSINYEAIFRGKYQAEENNKEVR